MGLTVSGHADGLSGLVGRILCFLGFHDFRIIDATLGFGGAGGTETVECRRCGEVVTRPN